MAIKPTVSNLNASTVGILNAIRDNASSDYYNAVPKAQDTTESIKAVGQSILSYQPRMNEFVSSLVNRIARVVVTSKLYKNKLAYAKQGIMEFGESIEEIFVDIAKVEGYDWNSTNDVEQAFKRRNPDIKSAFHAMNLQVYYPVTVTEKNLRQAFLSMDGVTNIIARIVDSVYSAAAYDEYIMFKYLLAVNMLNGNVAMEHIDEITDEASSKEAVKKIKYIVGDMHYMSDKYNIAGVNTFIPDEESPETFITVKAEADMDVDVLAVAFNMDKVQWTGRRVQVDSLSFNPGELKRLKMLLANDPTYVEFTETELNALKTVPVVLLSRDYFRVYDNLLEFTEQYNGAKLYWNEFLHKWSTYSTSPFAPICALTSSTPTITRITVSAPANAAKNSVVKADANVTATPFANKGVTFSITPATNVSIDEITGLIKFGPEATGNYTVKATSVFDPKKSGTATIAVS